ncbi:DUF3267 domain-containing protein [Bacillus solitudinis]|uniref:DUF3267 domain-containing protein n=1 Tax=Bacillus solitudinis TaxID=2014074 RepID=UPI000C24B5CB|nr:DUF3267 domain-containing protein [Bacillus solitudinis]
MNCWKTINIARDYGTLRLIMFSACNMLVSFLLYYLLISSFIQSDHTVQLDFGLFIIGLIAVIVFHKLLHCLPIWICRKKSIISWRWVLGFPIMTLKLCTPISKKVYLISLLMPVFVLTLASGIASIVYPSYLPLFSVLASINFGLCFYDFIYVSYVLKAPKQCFVEDYSEGVHILVKQQIIH